jgi:hypothetical protein
MAVFCGTLKFVSSASATHEQVSASSGAEISDHVRNVETRCVQRNENMSTPRRRRNDQEPLNQVVGMLATVPTTTGEIPNPVENLASRESTHEEIARRAYQLYEERGGEHGRDWEDWFQAERDLRQRMLREFVETTVATERPYAAA